MVMVTATDMVMVTVMTMRKGMIRKRRKVKEMVTDRIMIIGRKIIT
jgi:hypothetical protein